MTHPTFANVFAALTSHETDLAPVTRSAFEAVLAGAWTPVQVAGLAVTLRLLGDRPDVIAAAASALRDNMTRVDHGLPLVLDTCGTGGDGLGTYNLSTAAAFVVAGCGVYVAKHGNRAVSSQCGSADVLEELGVQLNVDANAQGEILRDVHMAFLFAPAHHPALKHGGQARRELGIRTIFNALGPLANPALANMHLLGAYSHEIRPILAHTLHLLGTQRAWVVRGDDGLDEVSPCSTTRVTELNNGTITERTLHPSDFGLPVMAIEDLAGGDRKINAGMISQVLNGVHHPARPAVILNSAAALCVAKNMAPREGATMATDAIDSGKALAVLRSLVDRTNNKAAQ